MLSLSTSGNFSPQFGNGTDELKHKLQQGLQISEEQASKLATLSETEPTFKPCKAVTTGTNEAYLIASKDYTAPGAKYDDDDVFGQGDFLVIGGNPDNPAKLATTSSAVYRDGGTTTIETEEGANFHFPSPFKGGAATVNGQPTTKHINLLV